MVVISVMSVIIDAVKQGIRPHVGVLVHQLPQLWMEASSEGIVQGVIIDMLTQLVRSLGYLSAELHALLLPIIQMATDVTKVRN